MIIKVGSKVRFNKGYLRNCFKMRGVEFLNQSFLYDVGIVESYYRHYGDWYFIRWSNGINCSSLLEEIELVENYENSN